MYRRRRVVVMVVMRERKSQRKRTGMRGDDDERRDADKRGDMDERVDQDEREDGVREMRSRYKQAIHTGRAIFRASTAAPQAFLLDARPLDLLLSRSRRIAQRQWSLKVQSPLFRSGDPHFGDRAD